MSDQKNEKSVIPIIEIGFDEQWEAANWYETIYSQARYGLRRGGNKWGLGNIPADLPSLLENKKKDEAMLFIKQRLEIEIKRPEIAQIIRVSIERAQKRWGQVDKEFFPVLSSMLDVAITRFEPIYYAYFTLSTRAPFGKNAFMFNQYRDFADLAMHEIMHIEFLKEYKQYCAERGLSEEEIEHLKEILTVLLNEDASHLLSKPESGYTKHEQLRTQVLEIYKKNGSKDGNFKIFLEKIIPLIKQANFN